MPDHEPGRGRIYDDITKTIGDTPLVRMAKLAKAHGCGAELLGKLEFFNPIASVKDRIGVSMIEAMEAAGKLKPGSVIVEATSGNTGIALAFAAAQKGYRCILVMPETMSIERRKMLAILGAELVLTPGSEGIKGAFAKADEILKSTPHAVMPQQFENPANPEIHRRTTAEEILNEHEGNTPINAGKGAAAAQAAREQDKAGVDNLDAIREQLGKAADQGVEAYKKAWGDLTKQQRQALKSEHTELKARAINADAQDVSFKDLPQEDTNA